MFDTIAAESQHQMNETYSAWIRGRLPKYEKTNVELIDNLNPSVIIDQSRLGGNARSTVGTISDMYSALRLLFSRIGTPQVGPASYFSFNNPNGMCPTCAGIGKVMDFDVNNLIDPNKTYDEGCFLLPAFGTNKYYWKVYKRPEYFRTETLSSANNAVIICIGLSCSFIVAVLHIVFPSIHICFSSIFIFNFKTLLNIPYKHNSKWSGFITFNIFDSVLKHGISSNSVYFFKKSNFSSANSIIISKSVQLHSIPVTNINNISDNLYVI